MTSARSPYAALAGSFRDFQSRKINGSRNVDPGTNPNDDATDIWYASLEGPEAGMYTRGTGLLIGGQAIIELPDHFSALAAANGMTVHITPRSAESEGLAVVYSSPESFEVRELRDGMGTYEFDWEVKAVRKMHQEYQVVRPWDKNHPDKELTEDDLWQNRLAERDQREQRLFEMEARLAALEGGAK